MRIHVNAHVGIFRYVIGCIDHCRPGYMFKYGLKSGLESGHKTYQHKQRLDARNSPMTHHTVVHTGITVSDNVIARARPR